MHVHIASSDGFGPIGVIAPSDRALHVTGDGGMPAGVSEAGPLSSSELAGSAQLTGSSPLTGRRRSAGADEGAR
ncbi:hypothetical protein [Streptosporangium pseudovulgare]|uniref:CHRD domain-containing protein n=1 Tax=Streptosporangium pseudovulgare TaxID=35765 RepID=A0ABQ2RDV2_9ACTN|nr:hypothetical protein [Streptosporangium pseudovulgare]GGQ20951.1 hypothetical protein GCM10010140_59020 [Streptosporangium pseudovulgare]